VPILYAPTTLNDRESRDEGAASRQAWSNPTCCSRRDCSHGCSIGAPVFMACAAASCCCAFARLCVTVRAPEYMRVRAEGSRGLTRRGGRWDVRPLEGVSRDKDRTPRFAAKHPGSRTKDLGLGASIACQRGTEQRGASSCAVVHGGVLGPSDEILGQSKRTLIVRLHFAAAPVLRPDATAATSWQS
jgi:hypothetical protein